MSSTRLTDFLPDLVSTGAVSAAVGRIERLDGGGEWGIQQAAAGAAEPGSWLDLGSLTKLYTATLALSLDQDEILPLDTRVGEVLWEAPPRVAPVLCEDLLRHRGGFAAWRPLYALLDDPQAVLGFLLSEDLLGAPEGTYSDLDLMLWGLVAERASGLPLAELVQKRVLGPLDLISTGPSPGALPQVVPCHLDNGREVELAAELGIDVEPVPEPPRGIVQDGNARFLGGLAAHAGLFAPAADVAVLAREWVRPEKLLDPGSVARALEGPEGPYALVWRREERSGAYSHTGFPGGYVRIDREAGTVRVLLAHKMSSAVDLSPARRRFASLLSRVSPG